jgi:DNA-directed RNA polymerase specialized sigma24 family protein
VSPLERVAAAAEKLRQADVEADRLRAELRQAILEAHREGKSLREIGRAAGISYTRVFQIVHESES